MADLFDALGGGAEALRDDLISHYQPADGQPNSTDPAVLTDRLARKLTPIGPNVNFTPADFSTPKPDDEADSGKKGAQQDLSSLGTPVEDAPPPSNDDLSSLGTPVAGPPVPEPGLGVGGHAKALGKGLLRGAPDAVGDILQSGAVFARPTPVPKTGNDLLARLEANPNPSSDEIAQMRQDAIQAFGQDSLSREKFTYALRKVAKGDRSGIADVRQTVDERNAASAADPTQSSVYKAGTAVKQSVDRAIPMTEQEKSSILGRVGSGITGLAPYVIATAIDPALGVVAGFAGMGASAYSNTYQLAKQHGASDEDAVKAAKLSGALGGALGAAPLPVSKLVEGAIAKVALSGATFATLGEAQEAVGDEIAKAYYDPKAGYSPDIKRIIANFILGGAVGGVDALFGHGADQQQPNQPAPGAAPAGAIPSPGAQARGGASSGPNTGPQPGNNGPRPGAGPQSSGPGPEPGPGPNTGGPGNAEQPKPGSPPPGSGEGKGADFTMDAMTRAKMEKVYRHFGGDPSKMSDGDLFNAVNEHLRDTSSTGYTAKPETPEEAAARQEAASERTEREYLVSKGWPEALVRGMTPQQRRAKYQEAVARGSGAERPPEPGQAKAAEPTGAESTPLRTSEQVQTGDASAPAAENGREVPSDTDRNGAASAAATPGSDVGTGKRNAPIVASSVDDVLKASEVVKEPTPAQAAAGNYQHGHIEFPQLGLVGKNGVSIETGVGQMRRSKEVDADGKPLWEKRMPVAYGRDKVVEGADGDKLDYFIGPHPDSPHVFMIDQRHAGTENFDEHKVMLGFMHPKDAIRAYKDSYADDAMPRIGAVTAITAEQFKDWRENGDHSKSYAHGKPAVAGGKAAAPRPITSEEPASPVEGSASSSRGGTASEEAKPNAPPVGEQEALDSQTPPKAPRSNPSLSLLPSVASNGGLRPHGDAEVTAEHHQAVEDALGHMADKVLPVDMARAAEILADQPEMPPGIAFQHAVIENAVDQGFLTVPEVEKAYGPEVKDVLDTGGARASSSGAHAEQDSTEPRQERAGGGKEGGELQGGGPSGAPGQNQADQGEVDHQPNPGRGDADTGRAGRPDAGGKTVSGGTRPQAAKTAEPLNLLQFLASKGGLLDHPELRALDAHKHVVDMQGFPPRKRLVQPKGMLLDYAREAAEEAGYLHGEHNKTSTVRDLLDAIDDGMRKKHIYPQGEEPTRTHEKAEAESSDAAEEKAISDQLDDINADPDYSALPDDLKAKTAEVMVREGLPIDDAVERAAILMVDESPIPEPETKSNLAATFGKGAYREIQSAAAPKGRKRTSPERIERARSEEEEVATGDDAHLPDTGAASAQAKAEPLTEPESDERGQPIVETGAVFKTASGRETSPAPKIDGTTERKTKKALFNLDSWLLDEAKKEVAGNDYQSTLLKAIDPKNMSVSDRDTVNQLLFGDLDGPRPSDLVRVEGKKPKAAKSFDDLTEAEKKAHRDAPTWAEVLHQLPMHKDGRTHEHEIAFAIMTELTGKKAPKFNDLTPEQKHELLDRVKAPTTETGADNKPQLVIPGAEKAADKTMAQRAADAPLKPKANQKQADDGLFGDGHKQTDLLDMVNAPPKKPAPPKDDFDSIFDDAIEAEFGNKPDMDLDDVTKGLTGLFGKGLSESEAPFDDIKYRAALPYFKAGVAHFGGDGADLATMVRSLVRHLATAGMDAEAIRAMKPYIKRFTDDVAAGRETINAPSRSDVLESNRGKPTPANIVGETDVPAAAGSTGHGAGARGGEADTGNQRPRTGERLPQDHAPVVGAEGNLELPAREPDVAGSDAADGEPGRSSAGGEEGLPFNDAATDEAVRNAQKDADLNARRERQGKAEGRVIPGDISNIADTLPMLFPEQHDDVLKAEQRYAKPDGHGMLFTNGTGTGKTYSGLGVIKRMALAGKKNTLVVAPSQGILMDWVKSAKDLGLDMRVLEDTQDNGKRGLVATTYANLGANRTLADRDWDLVVADEAHKLSSDQNGTTTEALKTLRAITKHPDGMSDRARMWLRTDWDRIQAMPEGQRAAAYAAFEAKAAPLIKRWHEDERPKTLMMSATPFAYHFSLDYANGYLFEYGNGNRQSNGGYNSGSDRDRFFMQHLGYRMRTNKLTKPDADVRSEVMERQLHEHLKKTGSLSGRALTVDKDYDRKFVLAHNAIGTQIDQALNFLQEAENGRYRPIYDLVSKKFDYLTRMRLLEAIKAESSIDFINKSLALGRKVVVFHDYNEGGGINPFDLSVDPHASFTPYQGKPVKLTDLYNDFRAQNPYVGDLKFADYPPPITTLTGAFPQALVYNGTVSNKNRNQAKRLFNDDNSGRDIIIVQSAAGEAGISLHDTTGKKQRVLLNLGMPIRPTTSIQQEGRIYRVGQASDAIFRYMNTGTDWERWTFAGKIADRAGTAENLALGDQARTIRQSYIDAFSNAGDYAPEPGEGKGGKETDRAISHSVSEFDKAKTHYFANSKTTGKRDQREGVDYYATPEPIGLKMVEFAAIRPGEKVLEPSAGHGAISRYFPEDSARTLVEPSSSLASRAALTSPGARVVVDRFENLDKGANKFDAIVMNPPFGSGGKTAMEHLAKAASHLKNGGRIVALIPQGASADKRFDDFLYDDSGSAKGLYLVGNIKLPAVTFERAGTSISARIVVLEKQLDAHIATQLPQEKQRDYSDVEKIGDLFDRIENADMGQRLEPATPDVDIPAHGGVTIDGVELSLNGDSNGAVYADLKNKLGIDKFKAVMRAAEANEGHYLKTIKSIQFPSAEARQKFLDRLANPPAEPEPVASGEPSGVTFKTGETIHAKTGGKLFVATANERVERDVYDRMNAAAKANGGYYSSFRGNGAIPGFQFKSPEARQKFLDAMGGGLKEEPRRDPFAPSGNFANYEGYPGEPAGSRAQQFTLDRGRKTGNEQLVAYDRNGNVVSDVEGTTNGLRFTPEIERLLLDPDSELVLHHNHPMNRSFSASDIGALAAPGLHTIWAHGHGGGIYRVNLTPEARRALPIDARIGANRLSAIWYVIEKELKNFAWPHYEASGKDPEFAGGFERAWAHLINEVLRESGIVEYQTNFDPDASVKAIPGISKAIKLMADTIKKEVFGDKQIPAAGRLDRRPDAVRHPGNLGVSFDRSQVAAEINPRTGSNPARGTNGGGEAPGRGLSQPGVVFGAFGDPYRVIKAFKNFWTSTFQPELVSDKALLADPLVAKYKSAQAQEKDAIIKASESEWNYWNKKNDAQRIHFLDDVETAQFGRVPLDPIEAAMAKRYRAMLDANWALEKQFGSKAAFVEDYFPHIWERPDDWRAFAEARSAQMGPTWFQKKRSVDYITDGLAAGLKLKYTNPVDIVVHRLLSGVDMRQRMQLLYSWKDQAMAWEGEQGGDQLVKRGWRLINAPDRKNWVIHPDVQLLWKNGVEAKGLWQDEALGGSVFRGWMALKNAWVPVKLALSAFHPLHVLHINYSNGMAQGWDNIVKGHDPIGALRAVASGFSGPLIAAPGASTGAVVGSLLGSTVGLPVWGGIAGSMAGATAYGVGKRVGLIKELPHPGKTARKAWQTKPNRQTPEQRAVVALMNDGGFVPQLSEQMKIGAKRNLAVAWQKALRKEAGPGDWFRLLSSSMRRSIEVLQAPIFEQWIPNLKTAAYLQAAAALLKRRPELLTHDNERRLALRGIAKSIDNRFGEMFYGNLFWNRYVKDSGIASFLSLGWNLGFVREFGGAAMESVSRPAGLLPPFRPGAGRKEIRGATNKIAFAIAYMGSSALILGLMSALMDDEHRSPEGLDFIFPRIGGVNPDGSPRRITNMSYIREVPMLLKHVQERGGNWLTGTGELLYNKMMFEPFHELLNNRSYYGYNIWDENAPIYKQVWQGIRHMLGENESPMALSGASQAARLSGHEFPSAREALSNPDRLLAALKAKGVDLSILGFGPAPGYVEKSAVQNRIGYLYQQHVAPASKPHADEENSQEKMAVRMAIMIAKRDRDASLMAQARERGRAIGLTPHYMASVGNEPTDVYLFSRLPADDQKSILSQATPDERDRYFKHAHKGVKQEINRARYSNAH